MRRIAVTVVGFLVTFVAAAIASAADSSPIRTKHSRRWSTVWVSGNRRL